MHLCRVLAEARAQQKQYLVPFLQHCSVVTYLLCPLQVERGSTAQALPNLGMRTAGEAGLNTGGCC